MVFGRNKEFNNLLKARNMVMPKFGLGEEKYEFELNTDGLNDAVSGYDENRQKKVRWIHGICWQDYC